MKKKILTVCMALMVAASLAACGKSDKSGSAKDDKSVTTEATTEKKEDSEKEAEKTEEKETEKATEAATEKATEAKEEKKTEAEAGEKAEESVAADSEVEEKQSSTDYSGTYVETGAGKGVISVSKDGDLYMVSVNWSTSAAETASWTFSGTVNESGTMEYFNCLKVVTTFDEEGNENPVEAYNTGTGKLQFSEDQLTWSDDQENIAVGCVFAK